MTEGRNKILPGVRGKNITTCKSPSTASAYYVLQTWKLFLIQGLDPTKDVNHNDGDFRGYSSSPTCANRLER